MDDLIGRSERYDTKILDFSSRIDKRDHGKMFGSCGGGGGPEIEGIFKDYRSCSLNLGVRGGHFYLKKKTKEGLMRKLIRYYKLNGLLNKMKHKKPSIQNSELEITKRRLFLINLIFILTFILVFKN